MKVFSVLRRLLALSIGICVPLVINAQTLFTYTFTDVISGSSSSSAGGSASNLTFSSFTKSGVGANANAGNVFSFTGFDTGATNGSNTFSGSLNTAKYYEFTITPTSGYQFSLTSLTFDAGRSSTGPRQFAVRSSADSYGANLSATAGGTVTVVGSNVFQTVDDSSTTTYTGQSITLAGNNFTNRTNSLTFRIYAFNAEATTGAFRIDNFAIAGSVSAVPEPSTYAALAGAAALCGVMLHRRRQRLAAKA